MDRNKNIISDMISSSLKLSKDLRSFAEYQKNHMRFKDNHEKEGFSTTFFVKFLQCFDSILLLLQKDLIIPAEQLLRCLIELTCIVILIEKDEEFLNKYRKHHEFSHEKQRLLMLKKIDLLESPRCNEKIKKIEKTIKENEIENITSTYLLKKSGLLKEYGSSYFTYSESIHSNIDDIARYINIDSNGLAIGVFSKPKIDNFNIVGIQFKSNDLLIKILESISNMFGLQISSEIEQFNKRLYKIDNKLKNSPEFQCLQNE